MNEFVGFSIERDKNNNVFRDANNHIFVWAQGRIDGKLFNVSNWVTDELYADELALVEYIRHVVENFDIADIGINPYA